LKFNPGPGFVQRTCRDLANPRLQLNPVSKEKMKGVDGSGDLLRVLFSLRHLG